MVRESMYEASIAKTTASAKGRNRYRATPDSRNIGAKTTQIDSVETNAGVAMRSAIEHHVVQRLFGMNLEVAIDVLDLHGSVIHENSDRQRQSTECHDVDGFAERAQRDD